MDNDRNIGRMLDNRYEILKVIGTGGMAVVYQAKCHRLNRMVAIKILKDEFVTDEEFRRRFNAEGENVAMLSHPNIVSVYDVSSSDDANFLVMELIEGITLKQYMEKKGVLNWKETLHFAMQIAKALEHAHDKGVVHRDIKPHNVMVLKNGSVKVTDFGIARVMSKSNTLTKEALGSVHYISPEQAKGGWVDNRSDIYSLGVVMYEMLAGRPPYDAESPVAVALQHINGGAAMPSTLNPNIPGGLEQIIMKAMALDAKDRYTTAAEMLKDMEEFRKNPAILFNMPDVSEQPTQVLPNPELLKREAAKPRTTAERVAGVSNQPRQTPPQTPPMQRTARNPAASAEAARRAAAAEQQRKEQEARAEEKRSKTATIAIIACSAVAIIAIICFLIAISNGGLFQAQPLVTIPDLKGEMYQNLPAYGNFTVKILEQQYSDEFEKGQIMEQKIEPGTEVQVGTDLFVIVSMGPEPKEDEPLVMEDLTANGGMKVEVATSYLEAQGFRVLPFESANEEYAEGRVYKTEPAAGAELKAGQTVKIYVSTGPAVKMAAMPYVVGMKYADARQTLLDLGFSVISYESVENEAPLDQVIAQPFEKGTQVDLKETIVLTISEGPAPTEPPTEKPTEPPTEPPTQAPTVPVQNEVTLVHTIHLPADRTEGYLLSIYQNGEELMEPTEIAGGTEYIMVELTGRGVQYFELYIDGTYYKTERVEFTSNG
ncbi:MAG: Stk1 family PASTA domain-containing Ser/Thr kinase [Oscillospiraceae bacterium]|nr:Stk1 family PASTA domain-containing Ser/Thr kinase [Oscillospiraceae bacterium]